MLGYTYNIWHQTFKPNTPIPRITWLSYFKKWVTVLAGELFHTLRSSDLKCCPTLLLKQICKKKGAINQPYQKPEHTPPFFFFFTSKSVWKQAAVMQWWTKNKRKEKKSLCACLEKDIFLVGVVVSKRAKMHNQTLTFFMYIAAPILLSGIRHTDKLRYPWLHKFKAETGPYLGGRCCWIYGAEGRGVGLLFKTNRAVT